MRSLLEQALKKLEYYCKEEEQELISEIKKELNKNYFNTDVHLLSENRKGMKLNTL